MQALLGTKLKRKDNNTIITVAITMLIQENKNKA
jgi:hypothetical protein